MKIRTRCLERPLREITLPSWEPGCAATNTSAQQVLMETTEIQDVRRSVIPLALILCVGQDLALLETRTLILRAQGYIVESELSVKQAISHFRYGDFDLVLLCHSIPEKDRDHLTCLIRASGSLIPVITITRGASQDLADASTGCGPKELLNGVREVIDTAHKTLSAGRSIVTTSHNESKPRRKIILCIDDDPNLLVLLRWQLANAGYLVLTTQNCADGMKLFTAGAADAVILDYQMPTMSGGAVAAQMRQIKEDVPLILLSGCPTIPDDELILFDRSIPKGGSPTLLLSTLEELISDSKGLWWLKWSRRGIDQ